MTHLSRMIELTDDLLFAQGSSRKCFQHPDDLHKCIKIGLKEWECPATAHEVNYYRMLQKRKPNLDYLGLPKFYGYKDTNLGKGGVFELIRDEDTQEVSRTLYDYRESGDIAKNSQFWEKVLAEFRTWLKKHSIVANFHHDNICAKRLADGSIRLIAIDGIGHGEFIPVSDYLPFMARRKLERYFKRNYLGSVESLLANPST